MPVLVLLTAFSGESIRLSYEIVVSMAYIGFFEMGFTFVFWQLALQKTQYTARISSLIFLAPFISLFIINKVLGEPLQMLTFISLAIILVGLAVQRLSK